MPVWAGIVTAIVGAGLSAGVAYASAPDYPDPGSSSRKVSLASLKALPGQRMVERAARLGQRVDYPTGKIKDKYETITDEEALERGIIDQATYDRNRTGRYATYANQHYKVEIPGGGTPETRTADFTGYGDADIQGKLARSMAEIQLGLQQKYGTDFAAEAAKQAALADPEGTAARALLADKINEMEEARKTRERPVAEGLDASVLEELNRGKGVDDEVRAAIERTLARRGGASGTTLGTGDVAGELERGLAGEERMRQRLQKGTSYLSSGVSPQDAAYREEQQSMANMASFLGGRTPQSQFGSLSSGQQGASPMPRGPGLPGVDPNGPQMAQQTGVQNYAAGVRAAAHEVSPWFVGLNALINGANMAGSAGAKPFGRN